MNEVLGISCGECQWDNLHESLSMAYLLYTGRYILNNISEIKVPYN